MLGQLYGKRSYVEEARASNAEAINLDPGFTVAADALDNLLARPSGLRQPWWAVLELIVERALLLLKVLAIALVFRLLWKWPKERLSWKLQVSDIMNGTGAAELDIGKGLRPLLIKGLREGGRPEYRRWVRWSGWRAWGNPRDLCFPVEEKYGRALDYLVPNRGTEVRCTLQRAGQSNGSVGIAIEIVNMADGRLEEVGTTPWKVARDKGSTRHAYHELIQEVVHFVLQSGWWISPRRRGTKSSEAFEVAMRGWRHLYEAEKAVPNWRLRDAQREYEKAEKCYAEALSYDGRFGWARYNRAIALQELASRELSTANRQRLWKEASEEFGRCLWPWPYDRWRSHWGYAHALMNLGDYRAAYHHYGESLKRIDKRIDKWTSYYYKLRVDQERAHWHDKPDEAEKAVAEIRRSVDSGDIEITGGLCYALAQYYQDTNARTYITLGALRDAIHIEPARLCQMMYDPSWEELRKKPSWLKRLAGLLRTGKGRIKLPLNLATELEIKCLPADNIDDLVQRLVRTRRRKQFESFQDIRNAIGAENFERIKSFIAV